MAIETLAVSPQIAPQAVNTKVGERQPISSNRSGGKGTTKASTCSSKD